MIHREHTSAINRTSAPDMSRFAVEVIVHRTDGQKLIKPTPVKSWNEALITAQDLAAKMFAEDPMATRIFRSGLAPVYMNTNDLGDEVTIRPVAGEFVMGDDARECRGRAA